MKKLKVLWLSAISCNGNAHSFLNYPYLEQFLEDFEFIYHPILDSQYTLQDIASDEIACDILLIEGTISKEFKRADFFVVDIIEKYSKIVQKIVTVGTCATFGGIFRDSGYEGASGLHFIKEKKKINTSIS